MKNCYYYDTKFGRLGIAALDEAITEIRFCNAPAFLNIEERETPVLREAAKQLNEYFDGQRRDFSLPVTLEGTKFQRAVWHALATIPYGETRSYQELAAQIGNPKACRAVGNANNRNPIPILIPCHRVIGAGGGLVGYAGGLELKRDLLNIENALNPPV